MRQRLARQAAEIPLRPLCLDDVEMQLAHNTSLCHNRLRTLPLALRLDGEPTLAKPKAAKHNGQNGRAERVHMTGLAAILSFVEPSAADAKTIIKRRLLVTLILVLIASTIVAYLTASLKIADWMAGAIT